MPDERSTRLCADEIAAALHRKIVVVPVRVGRENSLAPLPRAKDLPSDIRDLVNFQKYDVVHENFARDIAGLAEAIARVRQSRQPKRAFPWAWTGAAASIVLSMSALVYALHTTPVTVTWATSAQARTTGSVPQTQPHRDELGQAAAFINETEDQARLEAFIKQFGDSAYAPMARARLEDLRRRQIAVVSSPVNMPTINAPEVEPADKTAFVEAEASQDVKQLLRFIARFPNSSYRSKALFRLGYVYSNGEWGLLVDKPQARHWYRKAAELGSVGSMVNLAHLYEKGLGGPRDHAEARRLYTKVTELPNVSDRAKRYAEEGLARMKRTW